MKNKAPLRAADKNKSTILIVFVSVYLSYSCRYIFHDMHQQLCLVDGHESGSILVDLFLSEALSGPIRKYDGIRLPIHPGSLKLLGAQIARY